MLDIRVIREHTEEVKEGVRRKAQDPASVDEAVRLDERRRALLQNAEALKSRKNTVSAQVAKMKSRQEDALSAWLGEHEDSTGQ